MSLPKCTCQIQKMLKICLVIKKLCTRKPRTMEHRISPRYDHEKIENPTLEDLIDVFEDSWRGFVLTPAKALLKHPDGDVAAMTLISSYFEAIWIYMTGEDSDGRSKEFFVNGFGCCFRADSAGSTGSAGSAEIEIAAKEIYKHIRCGLAHTGMLTLRVNFSRVGAKAFYLTYPKKSDGSLSTSVPVSSIVVNPLMMYEGVLQHFERYVEALRTGEQSDLSVPFQKAVSRLWGLEEGDNIIGMTEAEYKGRA